jgi:predicted transcriptional regulator
MTAATAKTDERGRVTLGKEFANRLMIVRRTEAGILLVPAEAVPAKEAWLFKKPAAIKAVLEGLADAEAGRFAEPPNLEVDEKMLADAEDE